MAIKRAQGLRLAAFRAAGAGAVVPRHHVEMGPRNAWLDEFLEVKRGGDRAALGPLRDDVEVSDLAVEVAAIGAPR